MHVGCFQPTLLFTLLEINECAESDRMKVSDFSILEAFLAETFKQAERFFLYRLAWVNEQELHTLLSTKDMTLVLQYFYALGTALGIGFRAGTPCKLRLPAIFHAVLSGDDDTNMLGPSDYNLHALQVRALALALRRGLTAVVPAQCLDLMRKSDISFFLEGCPRMSCTSFLRRRALYEPEVRSADKHVAMFWAALSDLSHSSRLKLLLHLWKSHNLSPAALTTELSIEDSVICPRLHFFPPRALATLCSDLSSILLFPDQSGISIPKYSNLAIMKDRLDDLLNSID